MPSAKTLYREHGSAFSEIYQTYQKAAFAHVVVLRVLIALCFSRLGSAKTFRRPDTRLVRIAKCK